MTQSSRRNFLKAVSLAGAAGFLFFSESCSSSEQSAALSQNPSPSMVNT